MLKSSLKSFHTSDVRAQVLCVFLVVGARCPDPCCIDDDGVSTAIELVLLLGVGVAIPLPPSSASLALAPNRSAALRSSLSSPHGMLWSPVRYLSASMEVASRSRFTGAELPPSPQIGLAQGRRKRGEGRLFLDAVSSSQSQVVGHLR
jgi:hypothetical protein